MSLEYKPYKSENNHPAQDVTVVAPSWYGLGTNSMVLHLLFLVVIEYFLVVKDLLRNFADILHLKAC